MAVWDKLDDVTVVAWKEKEITMNKLRKGAAWFPLESRNKVIPTKARQQDNTTFQESLKAMLISGQLFSLIPVNHITNEDAAKVKFVSRSWKVVYTWLLFFGQLFMSIMCVFKVFSSDTSLKATTTVIFYATSCITMFMFFQMARDWPKLVEMVIKNEERDPSSDKRLPNRCNITCAVILSLALLEHILSLNSAFAASAQCYPDTPVYEGFVRHFYPWVFDFLPYSFVLGMITQFLHFQSTFVWNFSDLFVISLSYYLTSKLEKVNKKLQAAQGKYLPEPFWRSTREEYGRVTRLIRKVDDVISGIIFMSFANNLFFICFQLFNTLENGFKGRVQCSAQAPGSGPVKGYAAVAYFSFSLVYLITRSVAVSLIAAEVNTASMVPAPVLYDVPSPVYCHEVQRFLDQVNGDTVALSGLRFFSVTRGLLLTVAGTIVTYELVMVQFNTSPSSQPASIFADAMMLLNLTTA